MKAAIEEKYNGVGDSGALYSLKREENQEIL